MWPLDRPIAGLELPDVGARARVLNKLRINDIVFRYLTRASAVFVLVMLAGVIVSLAIGSMPAFQEFGLGFLWTERWNPVTEKFGAAAPIYGTIITSFIAMLPLFLMSQGQCHDVDVLL